MSSSRPGANAQRRICSSAYADEDNKSICTVQLRLAVDMDGVIARELTPAATPLRRPDAWPLQVGCPGVWTTLPTIGGRRRPAGQPPWLAFQVSIHHLPARYRGDERTTWMGPQPPALAHRRSIMHACWQKEH